MSQDFLHQRLREQESKGLIRKLIAGSRGVDFSSNDYLGFARLPSTEKGSGMSGSTGSRLITGNSALAESVESEVASYHAAESGLLFNSGYDANIGLISALGRKGDVLLYDELSHASIYDGTRLSRAEAFPFRHNDLVHLSERLDYWRSNNDADSSCFVIVESVYSMDGDFSPLRDMAALCGRYGANLVVDEAHATGVFGSGGRGRISELGVEGQVFARVHTFGKALGCHGAIVLGSTILRNYLINFSRPFIYTTALPPHALEFIQIAYRRLREAQPMIDILHSRILQFREQSGRHRIIGLLPSESPVQSLVMPGNEEVRSFAASLQKAGYDVRPILSPTVPKGRERIRICLHAYNSEQEVSGLIESIARLQKEVPGMVTL